MRKVVILLVYLGVLLVYSHFTYRYVERPMRNWGRRLLERVLLSKGA